MGSLSYFSSKNSLSQLAKVNPLLVTYIHSNISPPPRERTVLNLMERRFTENSLSPTGERVGVRGITDT
jgi:hypothetical protein